MPSSLSVKYNDFWTNHKHEIEHNCLPHKFHLLPPFELHPNSLAALHDDAGHQDLQITFCQLFKNIVIKDNKHDSGPHRDVSPFPWCEDWAERALVSSKLRQRSTCFVFDYPAVQIFEPL